MKKLYTVLLAAAVACSASASTSFANATLADVQLNTQSRISALANKAIKTTTPLVGEYTKHEVATLKKAPAKAAPASVADLLGFYEFTCYSYGAQRNVAIYTEIKAGENENEVIFNGFRYTDVSCTGTVDFAAGTITIAPQMVLDLSEENDPFELWLCQGAVTADNMLSFNIDGSVVIKIGADGTLTLEDDFAFAANKTQLNEYCQDTKLTPDDSVNCIVEFSEKDTDDKGQFLDTFTEYTTYAKVEYEKNFMNGTTSLGECVLLSNFLFTPNSIITETFRIIVQVEREFGSVFINNWYWFAYDFGDGDEGKAAIIGITPAGKITTIEGEFTDDTISWTQEWGAYNDGLFGWYKGCTIHLPFSLGEGNEGAGIADIAIDNENAPVEYFNLQGMRINEPAAGQIVIRRQGSKTTKMLVK